MASNIEDLLNSEEFVELKELCENVEPLKHDTLKGQFYEMSYNNINDPQDLCDILNVSISQLGSTLCHMPELIFIFRRSRIDAKKELTLNLFEIARDSKFAADRLTAIKYLLGSHHDQDEQLLRIKLSAKQTHEKQKLDIKKYKHDVNNSTHKSLLEILKSVKTLSDSELQTLMEKLTPYVR